MIKPLLALKCPKKMTFDTFLSKITFPQLATPKIDFLRCSTDIPKELSGITMSHPKTRSQKEIPNCHTRHQISTHCPPYLDDELGAGKTFQDGSSAIMTVTGKPDFRYYVFDCCINTTLNYLSRTNRLHLLPLPEFCIKLIPVQINNLSQLLDQEQKFLADGAEGMMLRPPHSRYDTGYADNRATFAVPWLIAIKRFDHGEAEIIDFEEAMENTNEQTPDYLGRMKRSSHQIGMFGLNRLGAFIVKDLQTGVVFRLAGFTHAFAKRVWDNRPAFKGKIARYKYQKHGMKDAPRIPTFDGIRDARDMS